MESEPQDTEQRQIEPSSSFADPAENSTCCVGVAILLANCNVFLVGSAPYTLLPLLAEERGVSSSVVGLVFATWGLPGLFSFVYPFFERCYGTKRLFLFHIFLINFLFILMGCCQYITAPTFFVLWAFLSRLIQAASSAFLKLMTFVLSKRLFPRSFPLML